MNYFDSSFNCDSPRIDKKLILLVVLSLLCEMLSVRVVRIRYSYLYCSIIVVTLFLVFDNPFKWTNSYKTNRDEKKRSIFNIIMLVVISIIILIRTSLPFYFFLRDGFFLPTNIIIEIIVITFIESLNEEILYKAGVYKFFVELNLNKVFSMLIVSVLFAFMHFVNSPILILDFIVLFAVQMATLFVFDNYPSVWFVSIIHFGLNIGNKLLAEALTQFS